MLSCQRGCLPAVYTVAAWLWLYSRTAGAAGEFSSGGIAVIFCRRVPSATPRAPCCALPAPSLTDSVSPQTGFCQSCPPRLGELRESEAEGCRRACAQPILLQLYLLLRGSSLSDAGLAPRGALQELCAGFSVSSDPPLTPESGVGGPIGGYSARSESGFLGWKHCLQAQGTFIDTARRLAPEHLKADRGLQARVPQGRGRVLRSHDC